MSSFIMLSIMAVILLFSFSGIHADTASTSSDRTSGTECSICQVQHLINQESMLRLNLDRQLQELRSLFYDLKSKMEESDERYKTLESKISNVSETTNYQFLLSEESFSQLKHSITSNRNELNIIRQSYPTIDDIDKKLNQSYEVLSTETFKKFSTLDQEVLDLRLNVSYLKGCAGELQRRKSVFFSACLTGIYKTIKQDDVLKYNDVLTNKGGGYNASTGMFTCPVSGTYMLTFRYVIANSGTKVHGRIVLNNKDDIIRGIAVSDQRYNAAGGSILYQLKKGDTVHVRISEGYVRIHGYDCSSFSGMLISEE